MLMRAGLVLILALAGAATIHHVGQAEPPAQDVVLTALPWELDSWHGRPAATLDAETLATLGADRYLTRTYIRDGVPLGLYVGYWATQRDGTSIHSPLHCLPGTGWQPLASSAIVLATTNRATAPISIPVNRYVVERSGDRQLVLYWYQGRGRVVGNEYMNRWFQVVDAVRRRRSDNALVRIMVPAVPAAGPVAAENAAERFAAALFPWLDRLLPA